MKFAEHLRPARTAFLIGLGVFILGGVLWRCGQFQRAELWVYDHFVWFRAPSNASDDRIILVELKEEDIRGMDYPIRDKVFSQLLEKIESGGPDVIGNDFYRDLPEPRDGSESAILDKTLIDHPNIVSIFKTGDHGFQIPPPKIFVSGPNADPTRYGFNDLTETGVVRRAFMDLREEGASYNSFALLLAEYYLQDHNVVLSQKGDDIVMGKTVIPRFHGNDGGFVNASDFGYQFLQDFRGPSEFKVLSIGEVLAMTDPSIFKDKIVLIGNGADSSNDTFITPLIEMRETYAPGVNAIRKTRSPGVEIHAQIVNQLLRAAMNGDRPTTSLGLGFSWFWLALWCLVGVVVGLFVRSYLVAIAAAVIGAGFIVLAGWLSFLSGYWILVFAPICEFLFTTGLVKFYAATHEGEQREKLMKLFSQRVTPEVAEEIWTQRETFLQGGRPAAQRLTVTVLFTDLKNYSTISENMTPAELIAWINECQGTLAKHVRKNGGMVNCYMGDGMMAVFGAPVPRTRDMEFQRDAINAVKCALSMSQEIRQMNARWRQEGKPLAGLRVGIFTGVAMAGSLGSDDKVEYSIIGDTVNTASRLESVDKEGTMTNSSDECRILIGTQTYNYIKDVFTAKHVGTVTLKGKAQTTEVYNVLDSTLQPENNSKSK